MFGDKFPHFNKGSILKKEMLESLRDYPRDFFELRYKNYSDGVVLGMNITVEDEYICIDRGVVKHSGEIYILKKVKKIKYENSNREIMIKIKIEGVDEKKDFTVSKANIVLDDNLKLENNEMELGRFKLREGAKLRSEYSDFVDFVIEYNMINIVNVKQSYEFESTINPVIIKKFAKKILKKLSDNVYDVSFYMICTNSEVVSRELISSYLIKKMNLVEKEYSNLEMYNYMSKILKESRNGKDNSRVESQRRRPTRIIVD